jgi:hypothetical protein
MSRLLPWLLLVGLLPNPARALEEARVCFNYGCSTQALVSFEESELEAVAAEFAGVASRDDERDAAARAVGRLYALAAERTPIGQDRGENVYDDGLEGSMDCIDHSTNTTTFLAIAERRGWLRFHRVGERVQRGWFLTVHWTATLVGRDGGGRYAVDTWFLDPGEAAFVGPLEKWRDGARPARRLVRRVSE